MFRSVQLLSRVWPFATPWIASRQASININFDAEKEGARNVLQKQGEIKLWTKATFQAKEEKAYKV